MRQQVNAFFKLNRAIHRQKFHYFTRASSVWSLVEWAIRGFHQLHLSLRFHAPAISS